MGTAQKVGWTIKKGKHKRCPTAEICHCLAPTLKTFWECCGWYCHCGGRLTTKEQIKKAVPYDGR
jgi:hypothetical protein